MRVEQRITLGIAVITFATLLAGDAAISIWLDRYQQDQFDAALVQVARAEADEAPRNDFSFTTRPGPAANDVGPLDKYGVMFDESGAVLSLTPPFDRAPPPKLNELPNELDRCFDFAYGNSHLRGVIVVVPGHVKRRLLLAASRDDLDGDSVFLQKALGLSSLVALVLILGSSGWLVRRMMKEHDRIAATLHQIAHGDFAARAGPHVSTAEYRRIGDDIDEIASRLSALIEHQQRFIAHAAHELRSPLTALYGELQLSLRKRRDGEEYERIIGKALRATVRLKQLADDLLQLARAERVAPSKEAVALEPLVAELGDSLHSLLREKELSLLSSGTAVTVLCSREVLERILRNLLDNAVRHSPPGGTIRVEARVNGVAEILVSDEGPGVAAFERERIFEPFYRSAVDRANAQDGAGLGLAIARELAQANGGDLKLGESARTTFIVTLSPSQSH
jgi:two-component system OmpR family sensor kinase